MISCSTMGHDEVPATLLTTCEGTGSFPYCNSCAEIMLRHGEDEVGTVGQVVTDPMQLDQEGVVRAGRQLCRMFQDLESEYEANAEGWQEDAAAIIRAYFNG